MKIVIVGSGKVGYTLAGQLCDEDNDVTVVDNKETSLKRVTGDFDVMGLLGDGASFNTLTEAGIEKADLLIAVTDSDERNLLCCMIAKKAGDNCQTIARVRNPIYSAEREFLKEGFGLAMIINPEMAAAAAMERIFRFPSAIKIDTLNRGRIELLRFKVGKESILREMPIADIRSALKCDVLVCMVKRGNDVIIPTGDFVVQENDILAIVGDSKRTTRFFKAIGLRTNRVHNVMIVGGGKISFYLAKRLIEKGVSVKIIERKKRRCEELSDLLPKAAIICGDGTDNSLLLEEGVRECEGFAALTNIDEENILLSLNIRKFSKGKIITKINRITFDEVINDLDLDSVVYPKFTTADAILQYVRSMQASYGSNMENLYTLEGGCAEAQEYLITAKSAVVGTPLNSLNIKPNVLVCYIVRNDKAIIPSGDDEILVGDRVIIVHGHRHISSITDILA